MTTTRSPILPKSPTGIQGLDELLGGGFPQGRTTLLLGDPGSGKTVLALQTLVNGARLHGEPGIFVAFEESPKRIIANAAAFGWDLVKLQRKKLCFIDAQMSVDLIPTGGFDLQGLLASLDAKVRMMGAKRIVFDAVDILLRSLSDPIAQRQEIQRLHEWLLNRGLTGMITAKTDLARGRPEGMSCQLQYMVDCSVALNHRITLGVSLRTLRVMKYRGSVFAENEMPMVINQQGMNVVGIGRSTITKVSGERISTGVKRLDTMLGGGYYRGANILITGAPGTAKSTLSGAFAEAACSRGERTLFVSFDTDPQEFVRNLTSVKINLGRYVANGLLRMEVGRMTANSAEVHLMNIKAMALKHRPRCLIIDPISAWGKIGNESTASDVIERLIDWSKSEGLTTLSTSLLGNDIPHSEATSLQISTIADTWIHLSYLVHAGERNRALTIIKSRGTSHSNQVRELILSDQGISLSDVYAADGQVLMGTMRWEKERADRAEQGRIETDLTRKRLELSIAQGDLEDRVKNLQRELELKRVELDLLVTVESQRLRGRIDRSEQLKSMRRADSKPDSRRPIDS